MKNVVHLTYRDDGGGAAIAAYRLHSAMLNSGIDSRMVVLEKRRGDDSTVTIYNNIIENCFYKFKSYVIGEKSFVPQIGIGHYSFFNIGSFIKNNPVIMSADVIYLLWINKCFLNCSNIEFLLKHNKKVIWVMHDMFPITGGCHHAFGCEEYKNECAKCPFFNKKGKVAKRQLKTKEKLKKYNNMFWVAPSKWLYKCACDSMAIDKERLICIPNIISSNFFHLDKLFARKALGLSPEKKYILYGAEGVINNLYKGFNYFESVIKILSEKLEKMGKEKDSIEILIFGAYKNNEIEKRVPLKINFMGEINDERTMNLLYNAADVMVVTSIAENYPLTIQESTTCGTPVIAFDVGGIPDLIDNDHKGKLIPAFNSEEMAEATISYLDRLIVQELEIYDNNNLEKYIAFLN